MALFMMSCWQHGQYMGCHHSMDLSCKSNSVANCCLHLLQYAKSLEDLRKSAEEDMDVAKRKDGLDWVNVDPAQLKPKMT